MGTSGKFGPIDAQFIVPNGVVGGSVDGPWMNYARNNRVMDPAYQTNDAAMEASCPYQEHLDHWDLLDDLITLPGTLSNPSSALNEIDTEEIGSDLTSKNNDIPPQSNPYLIDRGSYTTCTEFSAGPDLFNYFGGTAHHGSYPDNNSIPAWSSPWNIVWDDGIFINTGSQPSVGGTQCTDCYIGFSPPTLAAEAGASAGRFIDTAFYQSTSKPTSNQWENIVTTILQDANVKTIPGGVPNPVFDIAAESVGARGSAATTYWVRGNTYLVQQYPFGIGGPVNMTDIDAPYDNKTSEYEPLFPVQYAPLGVPVEPLIPFAIPTCSPFPSCIPTIPANQDLSTTDLFNSTDKLFERWYTNGVVIMCGDELPHNCLSHTFPQTVYLLNEDAGIGSGLTGSIAGCTSGNGSSPPSCVRTYTPETTTGTMTANTIQIILFDPQ
jgi:hypothetical protein